MQSMVTPIFASTNFDECKVCFNLSGVSMSRDARAPMSSAPDEPRKNHGFVEPLAYTGFSLGGFTFCHQQLITAKPDGSLKLQITFIVRYENLNVVLFVVMAHAMRASLFARAHATTHECFLDSWFLTQSARLPEYLSG